MGRSNRILYEGVKAGKNLIYTALWTFQKIILTLILEFGHLKLQCLEVALIWDGIGCDLQLNILTVIYCKPLYIMIGFSFHEKYCNSVICVTCSQAIGNILVDVFGSNIFVSSQQ